MLLQKLLSLFVLSTVSHAFCPNEPQSPLVSPERPNFVFIFSDDQDLHMDSLSYMPFLQTHLIDHGTMFRRHYCTVALCCPSRASLWTGRAAHNTNVTDVSPPHGGYPKFASQGFTESYLPVWLQQAGYQTYYSGKLFNAQTIDNYDRPYASGWTGSEFLLGPYTYEYWNATLQRNRDLPISYEGQYSTDVVGRKGLEFLDDAIEARQPFFLTIAPAAPHSNVRIVTRADGEFTENSTVQSPPAPAERHRHLFANVTVPRRPHFNPEKPHGVNWIAELPRQNATNVEYNDEWHRNRLRALQAVDEIVDQVIQRLQQSDLLENTYIIYSTDNGYHIGQHRLQPGKQTAFEEDINIPLIIRGPGVAEGRVTDIVTTHTDLAPTIMSLAGIDLRSDFDGQVIPVSATAIDKTESDANRAEHVNVEMWGIIMSEGKYNAVLLPNHTYKAMRVIGSEYDYLYTVWCNNAHELYDLKHDPFAMSNIYPTNWSLSSQSTIAPSSIENSAVHTSHSWTLPDLVARLDTLIMLLKTCRGGDCVRPWQVLHPDGEVNTLRDAMSPHFNRFYTHGQQRVHFDGCEKAYIPESEGPSRIRPWVVDDDWSLWT